MGLVFNKILPGGTVIGLWELDSHAAEDMQDKLVLSDEEASTLNSISAQHRKKEFLATRFLIKALLGKKAKIYYDKHGKPHLADSTLHLSLSHSYNLIAVILDGKHSTGIDIQLFNQKIFRIKEKFLNSNELDYFNRSNAQLEMLHILWGAKECIYKEYGSGNLSFAENIYIAPFRSENRGSVRGCLSIHNIRREYVLDYVHYSNYMLVYITELVNIVT